MTDDKLEQAKDAIWTSAYGAAFASMFVREADGREALPTALVTEMATASVEVADHAVACYVERVLAMPRPLTLVP